MDHAQVKLIALKAAELELDFERYKQYNDLQIVHLQCPTPAPRIPFAGLRHIRDG